MEEQQPDTLYASILRSSQLAGREKTEQSWQGLDHELRLANELTLNVISSILHRHLAACSIDESAPSQHRCDIHADYIKSIFAVEHALCTGLYGVAATLIRREIEAVNNCYAHHMGHQKNKKNPHIKPFKHIEEHYKSLSGIAHNSDRGAMSYLASGVPANVDPIFDKGFCEYLLKIHIHCNASIGLDMAYLSPYSNEEMFSPTEDSELAKIFSVLLESKFLIPKS